MMTILKLVGVPGLETIQMNHLWIVESATTVKSVERALKVDGADGETVDDESLIPTLSPRLIARRKVLPEVPLVTNAKQQEQVSLPSTKSEKRSSLVR